MKKELEVYQGYEVGPIRPPSEVESLLLRITRNCPWNQCSFCSLYKGMHFSVRPVDHIIKDIELIESYINGFNEIEAKPDALKKEGLERLRQKMQTDGRWGYKMALNWYRNGMESIFLQDANSMVMKPEDLITILKVLGDKFDDVKRITTYARSHTIAKISDAYMKQFAEAGLNRIHIGMESSADTVLDFVKKGVDKETHIAAGRKVKAAGIELSEYFMPGLGGLEYSESNALETADALNQINPDFIRIRTLAVTKDSMLYKQYQEGLFTRINDTEVVKELRLFVENLEGIESMLKSDHILNLLPEVEGQLPQDKEKILSVVDWYLKLEASEQNIYRMGRRSGIMNCMADLSNTELRQQVDELMVLYQVTEETIDQVMDQLMCRYI